MLKHVQPAILGAVLAVVLAVAACFDNALAQDVDLDVVFRCRPGEAVPVPQCRSMREMVLQNCTVCHTFVPIVMQQFDGGGWQGLLDRHRDRVAQLSDRQVASIHDYLTATFNEQHEPPDLPEELLKTWTTY